jgi:arylformamidase
MARRVVDLSHEIVDGMTTHPGIPAPRITTFLSHAESAGRYADGTTFEIGRIDLVANTGTYVDTPAHRFAGRADLSGLALESIVDLPGVVVDLDGHDGGVEPDQIDIGQMHGQAVLVRTGWDRHWGTPAYLSGNPFLTEAAARALVDAGAALVGIDSVNVDSLVDPGIPLVEHLTGLGGVTGVPFRFFAVPPRIVGMATFPVRAFAILEDGNA